MGYQQLDDRTEKNSVRNLIVKKKKVAMFIGRCTNDKHLKLLLFLMMTNQSRYLPKLLLTYYNYT